MRPRLYGSLCDAQRRYSMLHVALYKCDAFAFAHFCVFCCNYCCFYCIVCIYTRHGLAASDVIKNINRSISQSVYESINRDKFLDRLLQNMDRDF